MVQGTTVTLILTDREPVSQHACMLKDETVSFQEHSLMHLYFFLLASVFSFLLPQCKGVKQRVSLHLCCSYLINQEKRSGKVTHTAPKCNNFQELWGECEKSDVIRPRTLLAPGNHDGQYWVKCPLKKQCRNGSSPKLKKWSLLSQH